MFNLFFFKWKSIGTENSKFQSKTWVKLWQITQTFLNNHFTNAIIQKLIKLTLSVTTKLMSEWKIR